ncbi:MAG: enoyl-CoA hydratase/isomerase family protein [Halieaceae bacterium]|jgi:methylglutaconyl-CoA hydratase|nr:enoyl-CoA hydratase/isomerase family protein [Halieaceae bacterium]
MTSDIDFSRDARGVATLTLARPDKHNAFNDSMIAEISRVLLQVAADPDIRVLVLAATGRSFSAGADLAWMQKMASYSERENLEDARALAGMLQDLNNLPQPTIARVQGAAYGGAVGLVSCCDMAVGSERAQFCLSEVKIGLIPATISPYVIRAIGERAARRYFCSAEVIDAQQAAALGLLSEVVSEGELDAAVAARVDGLLDNGPQAVKAAKALVLEYAGHPVDKTLIEDSCNRIARVRVSAEGQAGLQAFLNKAAPPWKATDV